MIFATGWRGVSRQPVGRFSGGASPHTFPKRKLDDHERTVWYLKGHAGGGLRLCDPGLRRIHYLQHSGFSGSVRRRHGAAGCSAHGRADPAGLQPMAVRAAFLCGGRAGRLRDGASECQAADPAAAVRHPRDDRPALHQSGAGDEGDGGAVARVVFHLPHDLFERTCVPLAGISRRLYFAAHHRGTGDCHRLQICARLVSLHKIRPIAAGCGQQ